MKPRPLFTLAAALPLTLALALSGCVNIGGGKAPDHLYGLGGASLIAGPAITAAPAEVLVIAEPDVIHALSVTRVAVSLPDGSVAYLKGGAWIDRPARLLRDQLAEAIRSGGKRLVMLEDAETPPGAQRLSARLTAFGYDVATHSAIIRYDALLRASDGKLSQRRFEVSEKVSAPKVQKVVAALNTASAKLAIQVAQWVR